MATAAARSCLLLAVLAACMQLAVGDGMPPPANSSAPPRTVHIATTACGAEAAEGVIVLLKSIAIHADPANMYFVHVFMSNHTEFPFIQVTNCYGCRW